MKVWFSAADLAGLPGLPGTARNVGEKAKREHWKSQPRAGKGGGREYHWKSLPKETRDHISRSTPMEIPPEAFEGVPAEYLPAGVLVPAAAAPALPVAPVQPRPDPLDLRANLTREDLRPWQQRVFYARRFLVLTTLAKADEKGVMAAVAEMVEGARHGTLSDQYMASIRDGNVRGGKSGSRTLSGRTLLRWIADYRRGEYALAPAPVAQETVPPWADALLELYQRPTRPSLRSCVEDVRAKLPDGVAPPGYWQARNLISKMGKLEREKGRRGTREMRDIKPFRRRDTSQLFPGDIYTMDGHTFDAEVQHPAHARPFRPEITSCLDVATRKIVGFSVALSESGWAVLDALRHGCVTHGICAILYVDNGSGYNNALMDDAGTGILQRLSITKYTSIPYNSQARGAIERLHRSLWVRAAKALPTYMGDDMDKEARNKVFKLTRKQIKEAGVSPILCAWERFLRLAEDAVAAYNDRPHSGLRKITDPQTGRLRRQTPNEAWAEHVANGWEPEPVYPDEAHDLFRPYQVRQVKRGEVSLFGNTYFASALAEMNGELVRLGYDIHDPSRVWIRDRNDTFVCVATFEANKSSYFPVSAIEDAANKRATGREKRAERVIDEIRAEREGILGQIPEPQPLTPEQQASAQGALERLRQSQTEALAREQAETEARAASAQQMLDRIAPAAPASAPVPAGARPIFTSDFQFWLWGEEHPEAVTEQDRAYLAHALAASAAFRAQVDAELAKRARRGARE